MSEILNSGKTSTDLRFYYLYLRITTLHRKKHNYVRQSGAVNFLFKKKFVEILRKSL